MSYTLNDFTKGDRVELHPATDLWMRGARYGTVVGIGRNVLRVSVDRLNDRVVRVAPANIGNIVGSILPGHAACGIGEGRAMAEYTRVFDAARKAQGFKSAADLAAWFEYFDHTTDCAECQKPGKAVLIDDGYQPTQNRCDHAQALYADWCRVHDG